MPGESPFLVDKPNSPKYLIETILPKREVHLLGGPSGAGKTRWLLTTLLMHWRHGLPVLGYKSYPVPWVYIAADRTLDSVGRTMAGMGLSLSGIPIVPAWDDKLGLNGIFDGIDKAGASLAIIESFGSFVEPPYNSNNVKSLLQLCSRACQKGNLTIIGVVESPKMKPYERYENPRQRISGAAAWGHFSETIFLVEPDPKDPESLNRTLWVCPRNAPMIKKTGSFSTAGTIEFA
jgi:hypothetical protein